ncbi:MAG: phosphonopyruvate decarboxylase, partial [Betaproteobacteria bacterium]
MIEAAQFIEAARERGFDLYAGVPCSYLTPFINYVLQDPSLHYVSAANEGDAVALIAGATLGARAGRRGIAMMQNSGLGNAVSPLTSLTWTFRLPQLLIVTWRGQPNVADEPQHALMGPITTAMLDTMEIPWETFPTETRAIAPALDRAIGHMEATGRPYALVMQKGSVAPYALKQGNVPASRSRCVPRSRTFRVAASALASRREALRRVIANTPVDSTVVFASTGFCGRELYALDDRPNQLYMVGSMGCVTSFALGFALTRPDLRVIALDGDGAALMRMGAFATLG